MEYLFDDINFRFVFLCHKSRHNDREFPDLQWDRCKEDCASRVWFLKQNTYVISIFLVYVTNDIHNESYLEVTRTRVIYCGSDCNPGEPP